MVYDITAADTRENPKVIERVGGRSEYFLTPEGQMMIREVRGDCELLLPAGAWLRNPDLLDHFIALSQM